MTSRLILIFCIPFVVSSLTVVEDVYLTKQLMQIFGDDIDDTSDESEILYTVDDKKSAQLLSALGIQERADHYWTRLGHRNRPQTTPPQYGWDYYYFNRYPPNSNFINGKRKKRSAKNGILMAKRMKRNVESDSIKDQQNYTAEMQKPMLDNRIKKGFNKCCVDNDEQFVNENLQNIKMQCLKETRKMRNKNKNKTDDLIDGDGGLYNLFSCDRINQWKAVVTCTIDCMGQKLGMIDIDGKMNIEATKSVIFENFASQSWQQNISGELIDKCIQEVSQNSHHQLDKFGLKCSTKMAEFSYCMWREFFISCPADKQQKVKQCEKLRYVLNKNKENKFSN